MRPEDLANELILHNPEWNTFEVIEQDDGDYEVRSADGSFVQYRNGRVIYGYEIEDY